MKLFFHGSTRWWRRKKHLGQNRSPSTCSLRTRQGHSGCGHSHLLLLPCRWPVLWWWETALVLADHFQLLLSSSKKTLSINVNYALKYMKGTLEWNPEALKFYKTLNTWQANVVHQPACTVTGTPATCKTHSTEGEYVLTFSHSANSSGDPRSRWGWCDATCMACLSSAPSTSKASKGFANTEGLTSLHIWLGCANKQKEAASPRFFLILETEWNKADEQGSLILFCRAPQFSVNRDPESVIPCRRLSTIHWQGTINLNVLL